MVGAWCVLAEEGEKEKAGTCRHFYTTLAEEYVIPTSTSLSLIVEDTLPRPLLHLNRTELFGSSDIWICTSQERRSHAEGVHVVGIYSWKD